MSARAHWSVIALLGCASLAAPARAYQNPDRFAEPVAQGGGGDRHFTGSPSDAYTCKVCHAPSLPIPLLISGLPDREYEPGAVYRVLIDWPDELDHVALNMEMSDPSGAPLGQWIAPDPATLPAADGCTNPLSDTPTGTHILLAGGARPIVAMSECGQHQLSVDWLAPSPAEPPRDAWFSGSLLASNHDAKLSGDRVADFSRALSVRGTTRVPSVTFEGGCSLTTLGARACAWPWLLLLLALCRGRRPSAPGRALQLVLDVAQPILAEEHRTVHEERR